MTIAHPTIKLSVRTVHPLEEGLRLFTFGFNIVICVPVRTVHPLEEGLRPN